MTPTTAATWAEAQAAAEAKGGYLAVLDSAGEITAVKGAFAADSFDSTVGDGYVGSGNDGTWVGLSQAAGQPADAGGILTGWTWADGTTLAGDSPLWNAGEPNDDSNPVESGGDDFGAIYNGVDAADTAILYDFGTSASTLPRYLIEYDTPLTGTGGAPVEVGQTIAAADLANLSWNSVFNDGGSFSYTVNASGGPAQTATYTVNFAEPVSTSGPSLTVSSLIDDVHFTQGA